MSKSDSLDLYEDKHSVIVNAKSKGLNSQVSNVLVDRQEHVVPFVLYWVTEMWITWKARDTEQKVTVSSLGHCWAASLLQFTGMRTTLQQYHRWREFKTGHLPRICLKAFKT